MSDKNEMAMVAGMITAPDDFPVTRMRDAYSVAPTAVAKPFIYQKVNWNPTDTPVAGSRGLPATDFGMFLFRHPLRSAVVYKIRTVGWRYSAVFHPNDTGSNLFTFQQQTDMAFSYFEDDGLGGVEGPHGPVQFAARDDNRRAIWIDADPAFPADVVVTFQGAGANGTGVLEAYRWDSGQWVLEGIPASFIPAAATAIISLEKSGYYAFVMTSNSQETVTMYYECTRGSCWAHLCIGDLYPNNINNIAAIRVLAGSVLFRNRASAMNAQGSVVACQIGRNEDWYETYASRNVGFYDAVAQLNHMKENMLKDGLYAFLKPCSEDDFDYINCIEIGNEAQFEDTWFDLREVCDFIGVAASANDASAGDMTLKIVHAIEYKTHNTWIDTRPPTVDPDSFRNGVAAVTSMAQIYQNDVHWGKIFGTIGKIARVGAPILRAFGPFGNIAADVIGVTADGITRMKKRKK